MSGRLSVISYNGETDEKIEEKIANTGDFIFVPSMEPHSLKNASSTENATFLCCIANIYEEA
jgi:uncharacterized RmlC-like cupin family protein